MNSIWVMVSWFAGLWLGEFLDWEWRHWGAIAAPAVAWLIWATFRRRPLLGPLLLLAFCLGGWRYAAAVPRPGPAHLLTHWQHLEDRQQVVRVSGVINREPEVRDQRLSVVLAVENLRLPNGRDRPADGLLLVSLPRWETVAYGDRLAVAGRLERPPDDGDRFDYAGYLARREIFLVMNRAELHGRQPGHGRPWLTTLLAGKRRAETVIEQILPAPEAGLLSGILLGTRHALSPQVAADFQATGITHIVVISGFNISIVAAIFLRLLTPLSGPRAAAVGSIAAIALYTILVGGDAAVVRAAVMGTLFVISERFLGRRSFAVGSLLLAAVVMTAWRPAMLWDAGFQLSFVATLSLMLFADRLTTAVRSFLLRRFNRETTGRLLGALNEAVLVTLAAQILTLPLLMALFQEVSLISLLANALILPAQAGVMLWGGLATALGLVYLPLGQLVGQAAYLFLWYTIRVSHVLAGASWALLPVRFPGWVLVLVYGLAAGWIWYDQLEMEEQIDVRLRLRAQVTAAGVAAALAAALLWSGRWLATRPDGQLHIALRPGNENQAGAPLLWLQTPTGRQVVIIEEPRPTVINQFLGQHQPLTNRGIDLLLGLSLEEEAYEGWPAVLERYPVEHLLLPLDLKIEPDNPTWLAIGRLMDGQQAELVGLETTGVIQIEEGLQIVPLYAPASGSGPAEPLALGIVYRSLRLKIALQPAGVGAVDPDFQENLRVRFGPAASAPADGDEIPTIWLDHWSYVALDADGRRLWLTGIRAQGS